MNLNALVVEELSVPQYLQFKEELVDGPYVSILSKCCIIYLSPCHVSLMLVVLMMQAKWQLRSRVGF